MKVYRSVKSRTIFLGMGVLLFGCVIFFWEKSAPGFQVFLGGCGLLSVFGGLYGMLSGAPVLELDEEGILYPSHSKSRIAWKDITKMERKSFMTTKSGQAVQEERFRDLDDIYITYHVPNEHWHISDSPELRSRAKHCRLSFFGMQSTPDAFLAEASGHLPPDLQGEIAGLRRV